MSADAQRLHHQGRLNLAAFLLALLALAAGAALLLALRSPARSARPAAALFSGEWQPTAATDPARLRQIAAYVQRRYRAPAPGQGPLADVIVPPLEIGGAPASLFVIAHAQGGQTEQYPAAETALFSICGANADCSIPRQTAFDGKLAEREALELALRSFRADSRLQLVEVGLPSTLGQLGRLSVFFRRGDLSRALERPLRATLPLNPPPRSAYTDPTEQLALRLVQNYAISSETAASDRRHAFVLVPIAELQTAAQKKSG